MLSRKGRKENLREDSQPTSRQAQREMQKHPPALPCALLKRIIRPDLFEEVSGDLDEKFQKTLTQKSLLRAQLNYWFQVFNYLRSFALRKKQQPTTNGLLNNNIKLGWRQLRNQPMHSGIKIGGLALSIAACILITLFIKDELSYDQHFTNKQNTYRLFWINDNDGAEYKVLWNHPPLAEALRNSIPEIRSIARINVGAGHGAGGNEVRRVALTENTESTERENTFEEGFIFADPQIIEVLDLKMIYGNPKTALSEPMTMVITKRKADKYFSNENPVDKLMIVGSDTQHPFRIGGVIEDPPIKSHLQYDFIMTLSGREFGAGEQQHWGSTGFYISYVLLHENSNAAEVSEKMTSIAVPYMRGPWSDEWLKFFKLGLQPIQDVHLYSTSFRGPATKGDITFVWIFGAIAAFILIIACINFINLSTARSANRAKEVGLRKTIGSSRSYIINQFLTESIIISFASFLIGCLLAWIFLPSFNQMADRHIEFPWNDWRMMPAIIVASIILGVLAGLYPSFYLSSFRPIDVLKGNLVRGSKNSILRSTLVVFQFTTSIILIISTVVIYRQVDFMLNRKPGFDKDQVLLLHGTNSLPGNQQTLKQELLRIPGVSSVTVSNYLPVTGFGVKRTGHPFWLAHTDQNPDTQTRSQIWSVDHDYIRTMGMKIVKGRDFNPDLITDSSSIIINEKFAKFMGLEDPIGQQVTDEKTWTIIGVVEDFNFESVRTEVRALSLVLGNSPGITLIKISGNEITPTLASIEDLWRQFLPNQSIRYSFLDDNFAKMYDDVRRTGKIFTSFAVLAMIVACLGLFALSAFMIEQRGKEISIRILFGATLQKIFSLLTIDFLKPILISQVIAMPIALWMANRWLEGFHYRTALNWDVFVMTGLMAISVAIVTVSYQSIRAGLAKPIDKLRSE